jgi:hypothetical protein
LRSNAGPREPEAAGEGPHENNPEIPETMSETTAATTDTPTAAATFGGMTAYSKVRLFIPQTKDAAEAVAATVEERFTDLFGGATSYDGRGSWRSDTGELFVETVRIVESLAETVDPAAVAEIGEYVKETLNEEAVLFEIDSASAAFL